jgi:hypothetical protein
MIVSAAATVTDGRALPPRSGQSRTHVSVSAGQENALRTNAEARKRTIVAGCFEQEVEQAGAKLADVTANHRAPVVLEAAPGGLMGLLCSTNSTGLTCEPLQATMNSMMSCLSHSTPSVLNAPTSRLCANR